MGITDNYRVAPTWLHHEKEEPKLFKTQREVDEAWSKGWFGPPWLIRDVKLISAHVFERKAEVLKAVADDPRYRGLVVDTKYSIADMVHQVRKFEDQHDL
jgi:hypothetical protein